MLSNKARVALCNSLIEYMLPDAFAVDNGFSANADERIWLAYTAQTPRGNYQTVLYFSIKDEPYKQNISDPHHYDPQTNTEILEQMRQIALTIDCYSKVIPIGTAKDVIRMIGAGLLSDQFEEWRNTQDKFVAIENIEYSPDLTPLLEGREWNERQRMTVFLNYRDNVALNPVPMTRVPSSLDDVSNSVKTKITLKGQDALPDIVVP